MLFSSLVFIFIFLPVLIILITACRKSIRLQNIILLIFSLFFYAWGGVSYTLILLASILINYGIGISISRTAQHKKKVLGIGIFLNLLLLSYFKYANFIVDNTNYLVTKLGVDKIALEKVVLPIGISFFTFQAISYLVDVYKGRVEVQKNIFNLSLYISLFPQLIAGPIVRYHDINAQITDRNIDIKLFSSGVERFIKGLAKKVLLANNFAVISDELFMINYAELSCPAAWLALICFSFQIYFDFSGYSDMAIGLGRIFGFRIKENFNFPYISKSITEFWRRWHISLSNWFRDYLYIPLGGNRASLKRTYINLCIVFFITGLWHGASWNFIFWGMFHGLFLVIEKYRFLKILKNTNPILSLTYTLFVVMIGWVFFKTETLAQSFLFLKAMFQFDNTSIIDIAKFLDIKFLIILLVSILISSEGFSESVSRFVKTKSSQSSSLNFIFGSANYVGIIFIFLLCIISLMSQSYNPFIYYRF